MLHGDRVLIRGLERTDLPRLWEQYNEDVVVPIGGQAQTRAYANGTTCRTPRPVAVHVSAG